MKSKMIYKNLVLTILLLLLLTVAPVSFADGSSQVTLQNGWFSVTYLGMTDNGDGTSTWTYQVDELGSGKGFKDLSHWTLGLEDSITVVSGNPGSYELGKDPKTGVRGIKWNVNDSFKSGTFSFTVQGVWAEGSVAVATKAGTGTETGQIIGPSSQLSEGGEGSSE
jgi:hypothetical protein